MASQSTSGKPAQETGGAKAAGGKATKPNPSRLRRWRNNLILLSISTLIALIIGELFIRWAIFGSGNDRFKNLKDPGHYFYAWDADYWKMRHRFPAVNEKPQKPHPYLGWVQNVNPVSYYHGSAPQIGRSRPVLLYGDSFSACIDSVKCFEDILNADTAFSQGHFLLNHGVGGYGVCQSSLLCRKTAPHYQKPLVVFGLLTTDLDRTILPVRDGQKPYYDVEEGNLILKGYPIHPDPEQYFADNPMGSTSYLFRYLIHSRLNFIPYSMKDWYDEKEKSIAHIKEVNGLLIKALVEELRAKGIDFMFVVFHFEDDMMAPSSEEDWYDQFLLKTLADNKIPYIWSKGIIRTHRLAHPENNHYTYIVPGNGHPTSLYNQLISDEIKRLALEKAPLTAPASDTTDLELYETIIWNKESSIRKDSTMMAMMRSKARENGISVDAQVRDDAIYLMNEEFKKGSPFRPDGVFEGKWFEQ